MRTALWIERMNVPSKILGPVDLLVNTGAELDERWTELLGRKVWRNLNTGETWVEER